MARVWLAFFLSAHLCGSALAVQRRTRNGSGKSGKSGGKSGKGGSDSECECQGIEEYKYFTSDQIFELALARTAGADFGTIDFSTTDLTYTLAVSLPPPNCYIASASTDFEQLLLQFLPGGGPGFVGAFKPVEQVMEDSGEDIETRRSGWSFLDGSSVDDDFWTLNEPIDSASANPYDAPSVGLYDGTGLGATTLSSAAPGAYYKCCYGVLPSCFETDSNSLQNVLIPVLANA